MQSKREIYSPYKGIIKTVLIKQNDLVYEWEKLMFIEDENGVSLPVQLSYSGYIEKINVSSGERVNKGTIIGILKEDTHPCGSD